MTKVVLSIAGSDSGGGAGIQADLKTFERFGVFGATALTLITVQNTVGVQAVHMLPTELAVQQIEAVVSDLVPSACKTGALGSAEMVEAVAHTIGRLRLGPLVVDPVMISKHGHALVSGDAIEAMRKHLLPLATVLTPNIHEAARLLGRPIHGLDQLPQAANDLCNLGPKVVIIKGGQEGAQAVDCFYDAHTDLGMWLSSERIKTPNLHGTGCTFSAAIAALLAQSVPIKDAAEQAKAYITRALQSAPQIGLGVGPLNHRA